MHPLRRDFEDRCAYSLRHTLHAGLECMEVDHFNPTLGKTRRHQYRNLMWSTRLCNNAKRDYWPTAAERKTGARFLNPCEEWDYGLHIFEDPITHELFGKTEAGKYHVKALRLNRETFVWERRERAKLIERLNSPQILPPGTPFEELRSLIRDIKEHLEILVPEIPYGLTLKNPETGEH
ncbi:MAG: hypothetical protein JOZ61_07855 [Verrucomicrobia bacterium]|nr:hypothetical protein [Verrucomicrobiota bacterium]